MERRLRPLRDDHDGDDRPARDRDQKAFRRPVRLWLTELGYQSNPPDRLRAWRPPSRRRTSPEPPTRPGRRRASISSSSTSTATSRRPIAGRAASISPTGKQSPALGGFVAPLAEVSRRGSTTRRVGNDPAPGPAQGPTACSGSRPPAGRPVGGVQRTRADGRCNARWWRRRAPSCACSRTASRATRSSFARSRRLQPDETSATETSAHTTPTYCSRESRSRSTKAASRTVVTG